MFFVDKTITKSGSVKINETFVRMMMTKNSAIIIDKMNDENAVK